MNIASIKKIWLLLPVISLTMASCLKDKGYEDGKYGSIRNTEGEKIVSIRTSGLANIQKSSVLINTQSSDIDTVYIDVDLDYYQTTTSPQTVKLSIDNSKIAAYNSANNASFNPVTNDMARLLKSEVTIPAGQRTVQTALLIQQDKFDPSKSYMIPVSISEASGAKLSSNLNTKYFNIIGNPFAGDYNWDFTRYNNNDGSGAPNSLSFVGDHVTILPITETTFSVTSGYYIQPRYEVSFTNNNGVYSNFKIAFNEQDIADMKAGGVTISDGPRIIKADPVTKEFVFQFVAFTGSAYRYIIDRYYL